MEKTLIAQLKDKKAQLETALAKALTEKEYDAFDQELHQVNKTLLLAENQERQRQEKEAAEAHREAIADYEKELAKVNSVLEKASLMDKIIFDEMTTTYYKFQEAFEMREQAAKDTNDLQIKARELEIDPPESVIVTMVNTRPGVPGRATDYFRAFVEQYLLAVGNLKTAHKNKEPGVPKRPGMDWFNRGHGEFYPRDPEPPNPPKDMNSADPAKRAMAQKEYEKMLRQAKVQNEQARAANTN